jgi:hypothetical protein
VDTIFSLSNLFVMSFWALMILVPRWRWTQRIVQFPFFVAILALLYVVLVIPQLAAILPILLQPSVTRVATLLGTPAGATIGWIHFLAFDLFVGRWIYLDSQEHCNRALPNLQRLYPIWTRMFFAQPKNIPILCNNPL